MRTLVYGLQITGASTVRALMRRGHDVVACDDTIDESKRGLARSLGVDLVPTPADAAAFVSQFDLLSPAPGVPEGHAIVVAAQAAGVRVQSEIEIAYRWEQQRRGGPRPILAITGTDGKTTTTLLTVAILRAAGLKTEALGNTEIPLLDAIDEDSEGLDALVVECTSFRLAWTQQFRADAAVWLNFAPDHLNWHASIDSYESAKARIFELQRPSDVAIGFVDDPIVRDHLDAAPGRRLTFGRSGADYFLDGTTLMSPAGPIADTAVMRRRLPHDITNALAASALVLEAGLAAPADIEEALRTFVSPPHRIEPVGVANGISWFNDSKATTPHAASTAIRAFDTLVLIAGGSRKGIDLSPMGDDVNHVRAVIAIGEAAPDIRAVFGGRTIVIDASSMAEAVQLAAASALAGDAVVLSPGCASFDWYSGYPARGDDFRQLVQQHIRQQHMQQQVEQPMEATS